MNKEFMESPDAFANWTAGGGNKVREFFYQIGWPEGYGYCGQHWSYAYHTGYWNVLLQLIQMDAPRPFDELSEEFFLLTGRPLSDYWNNEFNCFDWYAYQIDFLHGEASLFEGTYNQFGLPAARVILEIHHYPTLLLRGAQER